jgi:hypothetical protein
VTKAAENGGNLDQATTGRTGDGRFPPSAPYLDSVGRLRPRYSLTTRYAAYQGVGVGMPRSTPSRSSSSRRLHFFEIATDNLAHEVPGRRASRSEPSTETMAEKGIPLPRATPTTATRTDFSAGTATARVPLQLVECSSSSHGRPGLAILDRCCGRPRAPNAIRLILGSSRKIANRILGSRAAGRSRAHPRVAFPDWSSTPWCAKAGGVTSEKLGRSPAPPRHDISA